MESGKDSYDVTFENLVNERYLISKYSNTSYNELGEITPRERKLIVSYIENELKLQKEAIEKQKQLKSQRNYRGRR